MEKKLSERKLAAQRQNAEKSTGPQTEEGKANTKYNAVKSGLTAASAVITGGPGKEDIAAFETHKAHVLNHYAPVGFQEEYYVEQIIRLTWRLRRADRYENGCIRSRMKHASNKVEIEASMLPESEPLRLTLRYQTTLGRRLDKLFADLERQQRRRKKAERRTAAVKPPRPIAAQIINLKQKDERSTSSGQAE